MVYESQGGVGLSANPDCGAPGEVRVGDDLSGLVSVVVGSPHEVVQDPGSLKTGCSQLCSAAASIWEVASEAEQSDHEHHHVTLHHQLRGRLVTHTIMGHQVVECPHIIRGVHLLTGGVTVHSHPLVMGEPLLNVVTPPRPGPGGQGSVGQVPGPQVGLVQEVSVAALCWVVGGPCSLSAVPAAVHHPTALQTWHGGLDTSQTVPTVAVSLLLVNYRHKTLLNCY